MGSRTYSFAMMRIAERIALEQQLYVRTTVTAMQQIGPSQAVAYKAGAVEYMRGLC